MFSAMLLCFGMAMVLTNPIQLKDAQAVHAEGEAILDSSTWKTFRDANKAGVTRLVVETNHPDTTGATSVGTNVYAKKEGTTITIFSTIDKKVDANGYELFKDMTDVVEMDLANLDMSNCRYYDGMFYNCSSLVSLDLSSWDVYIDWEENGYDITAGSMFEKCSSLKYLDFSSFDALTHIYNNNDYWYDAQFFAGWDASTASGLQYKLEYDWTLQNELGNEFVYSFLDSIDSDIYDNADKSGKKEYLISLLEEYVYDEQYAEEYNNGEKSYHFGTHGNLEEFVNDLIDGSVEIDVVVVPYGIYYDWEDFEDDYNNWDGEEEVYEVYEALIYPGGPTYYYLDGDDIVSLDEVKLMESVTLYRTYALAEAALAGPGDDDDDVASTGVEVAVLPMVLTVVLGGVLFVTLKKKEQR